MKELLKMFRFKNIQSNRAQNEINLTRNKLQLYKSNSDNNEAFNLAETSINDAKKSLEEDLEKTWNDIQKAELSLLRLLSEQELIQKAEILKIETQEQIESDRRKKQIYKLLGNPDENVKKYILEEMYKTYLPQESVIQNTETLNTTDAKVKVETLEDSVKSEKEHIKGEISKETLEKDLTVIQVETEILKESDKEPAKNDLLNEALDTNTTITGTHVKDETIEKNFKTYILDKLILATEIRNDYHNTRNHRLLLRKASLNNLALLIVVLILVIIIWSAFVTFPADVPPTDKTVSSEINWEDFITVILYGCLGASLSLAKSIVSTSTDIRIPKQLEGIYIFVIRISIGGTFALISYLLLKSGVLNSLISDELTQNNFGYLVIGFLAGYKDDWITKLINNFAKE